MKRVFDASAVLAAIFEESGGETVAELWAEGENLERSWTSLKGYSINLIH